MLCVKSDKSSDFLDWKQLKIIYHALVESHLSYGIIVWGAADKAYLNDICILPRRILKLMSNKKSIYSTNALYHELNVLDIRQLYYLKVSIKTHSERRNLTLIDHNYLTRGKEKYVTVPLKFTTKGQHSYEYLAPKIYNSIPEDIKKAQSLKTFKNRLKEYLLSESREKNYGLITLWR